MADSIENRPADALFSALIAFSSMEMDTCRDFEALVDSRLARMKEDVMDEYRRRCQHPPPFWHYPREEH